MACRSTKDRGRRSSGPFHQLHLPAWCHTCEVWRSLRDVPSFLPSILLLFQADGFSLLCFALLCYAMLCYAMLCPILPASLILWTEEIAVPCRTFQRPGAASGKSRKGREKQPRKGKSNKRRDLLHLFCTQMTQYLPYRTYSISASGPTSGELPKAFLRDTPTPVRQFPYGT